MHFFFLTGKYAPLNAEERQERESHMSSIPEFNIPGRQENSWMLAKEQMINRSKEQTLQGVNRRKVRSRGNVLKINGSNRSLAV